jgi:hypothetical protein
MNYYLSSIMNTICNFKFLNTSVVIGSSKDTIEVTRSENSTLLQHIHWNSLMVPLDI